MTSARPFAALAATVVFASVLASVLGACATVHVDVKPITIYAKLDADVRLRLDDDVKALIKQNPDLF